MPEGGAETVPCPKLPPGPGLLKEPLGWVSCVLNTNLVPLSLPRRLPHPHPHAFLGIRKETASGLTQLKVSLWVWEQTAEQVGKAHGLALGGLHFPLGGRSMAEGCSPILHLWSVCACVCVCARVSFGCVTGSCCPPSVPPDSCLPDSGESSTALSGSFVFVFHQSSSGL